MCARILLATASLPIALASPMEAQWNVDRRPGNTIARATGIEGQMHLAVSCQESDLVLVLTVPGSPSFHEGDVEAQWDDGSTEHYSLRDQNGTLRGSSESPQVRAFIAKLRQHATVRLLVTTGQDEQVTDRITLAGSSRAIGSLPCSPPTDAEIRRILINQSIARYSGSCPCPYNSDRAGRRCGRRSAHSRPGGASPLCYPGDVSDGAVAAYRRRTER